MKWGRFGRSTTDCRKYVRDSLRSIGQWQIQLSNDSGSGGGGKGGGRGVLKNKKKAIVTPTETNIHRDALCFMVKTWARHNTTETVLNNDGDRRRLAGGGWRLVAVGWWQLAIGGGGRRLVVGGWWLTIGGWWNQGAVLNKNSSEGLFKDTPGVCVWGGGVSPDSEVGERGSVYLSIPIVKIWPWRRQKLRWTKPQLFFYQTKTLCDEKKIE